MAMTKQDFIALAEHVAASNVVFTDEQLEVLADFCSRQNPRFDRERWLEYIQGDNGPSGGRRAPKSKTKAHPKPHTYEWTCLCGVRVCHIADDNLVRNAETNGLHTCGSEDNAL